MLRRTLLASLLSLSSLPVFCQDAPPANPEPSDPANGTATPADPIGPSFRGEGAVPPSSTITFKFENPQLQPARFEITLHGDGTGHFISQIGSAPPTDIADLPPEGQERDIVVSDKARESIFTAAHKEHGFSGKCESAASRIAYQGTKTLAYTGPEAHGSCTYNYSSDTKIQWLTTEMLGIATTLEEGRRLAVEHAHGRLSLDAELEKLATLVHDGEATEVQNIAPVLQAIIVDEDVILRARRRAQALLDTAPLVPPLK